MFYITQMRFENLRIISENDNYNVDEFKGDFFSNVVDTATEKGLVRRLKKAREIF